MGGLKVNGAGRAFQAAEPHIRSPHHPMGERRTSLINASRPSARRQRTVANKPVASRCPLCRTSRILRHPRGSARAKLRPSCT
jgi:hypothetical protein